MREVEFVASVNGDAANTGTNISSTFRQVKCNVDKVGMKGK